MAMDLVLENLQTQEPLVTEETIKPVRFLRLNINDSELESNPQVMIARNIAQGLNTLRSWASIKNVSSPLGERFNQKEVEALKKETGLINGFFKPMDGMADIFELLRHGNAFPEDNQMVIQEFQEAIKAPELRQFSSVENLKQKFLDINIQSLEELQSVFLTRLRDILHDVGNPLRNIGSFSEILLEDQERDFLHNKERVEASFRRLNDAAKEQIESLSSEFKFEKQRLPIKELQALFWKYIDTTLTAQWRGGISTTVSRDVKLSDDTFVDWSRVRAGGLFYNLAQNVIKGFVAKNAKMRRSGELGTYAKAYILEFTLSDDGKYLIIRSLSNGKPMPQSIVQKGFRQAAKENIHGWDYNDEVKEVQDERVESRGIGMDFETRILEEYFAGQIVPENIEKDGETWACVTISLPLQPL